MNAKVGSLNVDLTINSARFTAGLADAQSRMAAATRGFKADFTQIKAAAKDVGISTNELVKQINTLRAELNPVATATEGYRQQIKLLDSALKLGAISQKEWATSVKAAHVAYQQNISKTASANAQAQAGMQQLSFQLNDIATMWAMGAKPMQIFASQSGQVIQAVQMMTTTTSRFGAFMAGPWGMAITAGIIVLSAIIPKLLETDNAMKAVELASNGLADAQSVLGEMFDLTTGKLKAQNEMLRLNATLMAINLRAEASQEKSRSQRTFGNFQVGSLGLSMGEKALGALGVSVSGSMDRLNSVRSLYSDFQSGKVDSLTAAKRAEGLNFDGLAVTKQEFMQAIADGVSYPGKEKIADAIEKSLKDNVLDPSLREDAKDKKAKKPKAADMATSAEQAEALGRYDMEVLRARLDLATTAEERADLEGQMLDLEKAQRYAEIDNDKKLTDAQKAQQRKKLEALYGPQASASGDIVVGQGLLYQQQARRDAEVQARLSADMLARQADTLQAWATIEPNTRKRAELESRALEIQQDIERSLLEQQIANGQVADADKARAELASKQAAQREQLSLNNMTPLQRYEYNLKASVANINDAMEGIQVNAMESLTDGIAGAIAGTQKLGDVFKQVAQQIIADLIRIQIQKAVVGGLSNALGSLGGVLGGGTALSSTAISGAGSYDYSSFGAIALDGARATGGPVRMGGAYLVGEQGPEIFYPSENGGIISNDNLAQLGGSRGGDTYYVGPGAEEFWGKVNGIASGNANSAVVTSKQRDTRRASRKLGKAR